MMAFFLLMWLLNATTEEQRKGLADYFSPNSVLSHNSSGTGQPFGGHTAFDKGAMVSDRGAVQVTVGKRAGAARRPRMTTAIRPRPATVRKPTPREKSPPTTCRTRRPRATAARRRPIRPPPRPVRRTPPGADGRTQERNAHAMPDADCGPSRRNGKRAGVRAGGAADPDAVRGDPALADLARQLAIDMTPEGLRIQILDEERQPMFATGSAAPNERARLLLQKVAPVLLRLSERHLDRRPHRRDALSRDRPTNWELSADRANATRRLLIDAGLPEAPHPQRDRQRRPRPAAARRSDGRRQPAHRHRRAARAPPRRSATATAEGAGASAVMRRPC